MATLRALECLVALVDTGSVTGAATSLGMSQPALSHQIAVLEKELTTSVAERSGRGVRITAAGLAVAEEARIALRAAKQAIHVGQRVGSGEEGRLRIACAETMTAWLLSPVLRHWRSHRAGVTLELTEHTSSDAMAELVTRGRADVAIGSRPTIADEQVEILGEEEIVAVAPAGHRFAARPSVPIRELAGEPFVHYTEENSLCGWVNELAAQHRIVLNPVLRTRSPQTAAQLAAAGLGVTVVPMSALGACPAGTVRRLAPPVRREVVAVAGSRPEALAVQFVGDLRRRSLPDTALL